MAPNEASHRPNAFSSIASNTGARSPGEELMTCSTSAVAVCCSNASRVSVSSRALSMAMTACAAKFCSSAISFVWKGPASLRAALIMPSSRLSRRRGTNTTLRMPCAMAASALGFGISAW